MKTRTILLPTLALAAASANAASFYDDFSTSTNTATDANPWLYGTKTAMTDATVTPFANYTAVGSDGISRWSTLATETALVPAAFKNATNGGSHGIAPGEAALHGGIDGKIAVAQYTVPAAGTYSLSGLFGAGDTGKVDLFVRYGGANVLALFDQAGTVPFSFSRAFNAGDTIEFGVGIGTDGFGSDSTPLVANVAPQAVPEPASVAALGLGALGLLRRRTKRA